ncbi:hypothetical protein SODALDRAFT_347798 [Sodiomyces alkalinus F11]|uniref:Uncharacterized protein n=1 Tax=Sodiomyces alkalinus (strain CBS 110278 / VKM F-3762 / F11) TaxID=1314773 RepID=A0A3N2Q844_SODAK|nr:hypothetical protein SODALDRAFT_347798 [Sodiomyces alkalinus F11]ROT42951.1 hypothetical protein SODALDRAFT_347798 [Sodiomyces alkalinus F11]
MEFGMNFGPSGLAPYEAVCYYSGLPSRPRLVARTGVEWTEDPQQEMWSYHKYLSSVEDHPIVELWKEDQPLPHLIMKALASLPWVAIDVLRVGVFHFDNTIPVVMLVTVEPGETRWAIADLIATNCKNILTQFGITDVEVEIKESSYCCSTLSDSDTSDNVSNVSDPPPRLYSGSPDVFHQYPLDKLVQDLRHLSDCIGTRIRNDATPSTTGTKGIYLNVAPANPHIWTFEPCTAALTCRRVVFRGKDDSGKVYHWDGQVSTRQFISQDTGVSDIAHKIEKKLIEEGKRVNRLALFSLKYDSGQHEDQRTDLEDEVYEISRQADAARAARSILDMTHEDTSIQIGHVLFAQELSTAFPRTSMSSSASSSQLSPATYTRGSWLRDYALVQVSGEVHTRPAKNRLPINYDKLRKKLDGSVPEYPRRKFTGDATEGNAVLSSEVVPDGKAGKRRVVGKFGVHGLTFGFVNGVKSVIRKRQIHNVVDEHVAWEICVVSTDRVNSSAFSRGSDSGSAIWDLKSRVLGMITAGLGDPATSIMDTTYATSMERILQDLEASGIKATLG